MIALVGTFGGLAMGEARSAETGELIGPGAGRRPGMGFVRCHTCQRLGSASFGFEFDPTVVSWGPDSSALRRRSRSPRRHESLPLTSTIQ